MAMAIRSMLGKLRSKSSSSSSSCVLSDRKSMPIMFASSSSINDYQKNRYELLSKPSSTCGSGYSSPRPFDSLHHEIKKRRHKRQKKQLDFSDYVYRSCGGKTCPVTVFREFKDSHITPLAFFAAKEFNEQKDAHLQFVRLVRHSVQTNCYSSMFFLTLEAIDDSGVVKVYQAVVYESGLRSKLESEMESDSKKRRSMVLILFGLVVDNGNLLKLIDRRREKFTEEPPSDAEVDHIEEVQEEPVEEYEDDDEVILYTDDRDWARKKGKLPRRPCSKYPLEGEILKTLHN